MFQFELWDMLQLMLSMGPSRAGVATDESPFIGFVDAEGNSNTPFVPISSTLITTGFTADVAPFGVSAAPAGDNGSTANTPTSKAVA
ncbi:hypothetical protein [Arthrobacter sp. NIO-1057]|uniref:hypothetical protein n=1 Tax=Arthrobacter sp. NIO-1057 TaxID=993071 RepID=UPI0011474987|nr:hypothetical protein [Arthrobacter sp. NIO-1057]